MSRCSAPTWLLHRATDLHRAKRDHVFVIGATEIERTRRPGQRALDARAAQRRLRGPPGFGEGRSGLCTHCRPTCPTTCRCVREVAPRAAGQRSVPARLHDLAALLDAVLEWMQRGSRTGRPPAAALHHPGRRPGLSPPCKSSSATSPPAARQRHAGRRGAGDRRQRSVRGRGEPAVRAARAYAQTALAEGDPHRDHRPGHRRLSDPEPWPTSPTATPSEPHDHSHPPKTRWSSTGGPTRPPAAGHGALPIARRARSRRRAQPAPAHADRLAASPGHQRPGRQRRLLAAAAEDGRPRAPTPPAATVCRKPSPPPRWRAGCSRPTGSSSS